MGITSVLGEINDIELGIVLPHEHLFIDLRKIVEIPKNSEVFFNKLYLGNRNLVFRDPYTLQDNAVIENYDILLNELIQLRRSGCDTLVDVTLNDIGRNPKALKSLSKESGINIIMGCGYYVDGSQNNKINSMTEYDIAKEIIRDITIGVDETGIKAGVIGEIGTSDIITSNEWKSVFAAGIASMETGKGIHIHTSLWGRNGVEISKRLIQAGVKASKICIDHIDVDLRMDYLIELLDIGVFIEFDNFGKEYYVPKNSGGLLKGRFAFDLERVDCIAKLIKLGYEKQILITNDICLKSLLLNYGGNGYGHVFNNVVPMLKDFGITDETIKIITVQNPLMFLK